MSALHCHTDAIPLPHEKLTRPTGDGVNFAHIAKMWMLIMERNYGRRVQAWTDGVVCRETLCMRDAGRPDLPPGWSGQRAREGDLAGRARPGWATKLQIV